MIRIPKNYSWEIDQAQIFRLENSIFTSKKVNNLELKSVYNYDKMNNIL